MLAGKVCDIVECIGTGMYELSIRDRHSEIDYDSLAYGNLEEIRNVFSQVVFNTIVPTRRPGKKLS